MGFTQAYTTMIFPEKFTFQFCVQDKRRLTQQQYEKDYQEVSRDYVNLRKLDYRKIVLFVILNDG